MDVGGIAGIGGGVVIAWGFGMSALKTSLHVCQYPIYVVFFVTDYVVVKIVNDKPLENDVGQKGDNDDRQKRYE
jgi:hypothetical protein